MAKKGMKLNKEPYKGVRDFYPEDKFLQNYIFNKWAKVAESFGYEEVNSSILEPTELYEAKTGEEIVKEQTYSFVDRGDRKVTLRPEMTPSVARMIAQKKRDLAFPVRWFSIADFYRYERPQRGRGREFYQLNCDLFGVPGIEGDSEIIKLAYSLMKEVGAKNENFEIRINDRKTIFEIYKPILKNPDQWPEVAAFLDKRPKLSEEDQKISDDKYFIRPFSAEEAEKKYEGTEITKLISKLKQEGINNVVLDSSIMRGLDYYTGMVFEIWDTGKENNRSLFGGGRYDNLLEIFGEESIPTVGFAVSDISMENFMETYNLLPEYTSSTDLMICTLDEKFIEDAKNLAQELRKEGLNVLVNLSNKKVGDQISLADKKKIPFVLCVGEEEINSGKYKIKNLKSGEEIELSSGEISNFVKA